MWPARQVDLEEPSFQMTWESELPNVLLRLCDHLRGGECPPLGIRRSRIQAGVLLDG